MRKTRSKFCCSECCEQQISNKRGVLKNVKKDNNAILLRGGGVNESFAITVFLCVFDSFDSFV